METILRSEEMAEIMLLPVRHHSPACSFQLRKVIEEWKPSVILVEGPDNANCLLPVMADAETKGPFAIYYSYHDKAGKISQEKGHYKCYYPFLEYSPELTAIREAAQRGVPSAFIDLPYGDILAASAAGKGLLKEEGKNNYNDDYLLSRNAYIKRLCEKTGLRSFDEFWEKYFELRGLYEESGTWFAHLSVYCALARENTPVEVLREEGCLEREAYMAAKIAQWALEHGEDRPGAESSDKEAAESPMCRILAVTGGFHTPGLAERLSQSGWAETAKAAKAFKTKKGGRAPEKDQNVYMMPYSMEAADALNGYASGMPFTGFYQKVWDGLEEEQGPGPYCRAVLDLLVASGKEVRKKEGCLSTYDEICAWQMAQGLGELRGKPQPGAYELLDAVLASYVKGECNIATDTPMRILQKWMTGQGMGKLCRQADVPPIIQDFEVRCKEFGLKIHSTVENEVTLSMFSKSKHRKISMFLHRMAFLDTSFARRVKGPNLQLKKDKNLMREIWKYKWEAKVSAALIDVSVHGATVEEAAASLVQERLKKEMGAGEAALLLTRAFEMGMEGQLETVYGRVEELILRDSDFYSIADALKSLMLMDELGPLYGSGLEMAALLRIGVQKLIALLPGMAGIKDENLGQCMDALKLLNQLLNREGLNLGQEQETYYEALQKMKRDAGIHAGLHGCICGLLYGSGRETVQEVEQACRGYLAGTREQLLQTAVFFRGLFYAAKDLIFIGSRFLEMLDAFFGQVAEEEFMELLPQLRMAFTYFTPAETDRIAERAAGLHGKGREDILRRGEILPGWYAYGRELDDYAKRNMGGVFGGQEDRAVAPGGGGLGEERAAPRRTGRESLPVPWNVPANKGAEGGKLREGEVAEDVGWEPHGALRDAAGQGSDGMPENASQKPNGAAGNAAGKSDTVGMDAVPYNAFAQGDMEASAQKRGMEGEQGILNRWRLALGKYAAGQIPFAGGERSLMDMEEALDYLYAREYGEEQEIRKERGGGSEDSRLTVPRWLAKVKKLFPKQTVEIMERHALEKYGMTELLTDPETLRKLEPNKELLKTILGLKHMMKGQTLVMAKEIVRKVAEELMKKLEQEMRKSFFGKLNRNSSSPVRSVRNLDIKKTIRKNLQNYDTEQGQLMLKQVYFSARMKKYNQWRVIICVDESGSMLDSVIHSAVMAGIFAKLPMLDVRLVIFDTNVVDLSGYVSDPVETLMSVQLGGGTNIAGALSYCERLIDFPYRTMLVLVSDLYEGGGYQNMYQISKGIIESGAKLVVLTALDMDANPNYDRRAAAILAEMGAAVGAMTPEELVGFIGKIV